MALVNWAGTKVFSGLGPASSVPSPLPDCWFGFVVEADGALLVEFARFSSDCDSRSKVYEVVRVLICYICRDLLF